MTGVQTCSSDLIEILCLFADLPEAIEVDLSKLEIGATLHLSDVTLPKGVKPVLHGKGDPVLVTVVVPAASSESEDEAPAPAADQPAAE